MDRYELNKNPEGIPEKDPESVPELKSGRPRNPNVEPMQVQFAFSTMNAQWYVKIKRDQNWEMIQTFSGNNRSILYFDTVDEAQEWCEMKGLL